jgi:hypothetical protein
MMAYSPAAAAAAAAATELLRRVDHLTDLCSVYWAPTCIGRRMLMPAVAAEEPTLPPPEHLTGPTHQSHVNGQSLPTVT